MTAERVISTVLPDASAGIAVMLLRPPRCAAMIPLARGIFADLEPANNYVLVRFDHGSLDEVEEVGFRFAEQALDVYSARGLGSLATQRAEREFVLWGTRGTETCLRVVDTMLLAWKVDAEASVGGSGDGGPAVATKFPEYHPAYRFYRLSQLTDDLFDSYRNIYLALELLVSGLVPIQPREGEQAWLQRAFGGCLSDCVPGGLSVPDLVTDLYKEARLPLFHAKADRTHFLPQDLPANRERIRSAIDLGSQVVLNIMGRLDPNTSKGGGCERRSQRHAACTGALSANAFRLIDGEATTPVLTPTVEFSAARLRFDNPTNLLVYPTSRLPGLTSVTGIAFLRDGCDFGATTLQQPFSLTSITQLEVLLQAHSFNVRSAKDVFSR